MLTAYLDDSDAETAMALTIAGYVANEEGWATFERHADQVCGQLSPSADTHSTAFLLWGLRPRPW
ncbi:MAG TPA: hypothetical protein VMG08_14640 [Allosphingosinicella sp.]|nr:hypothetical protein [Allosphingosinicella sp.]